MHGELQKTSLYPTNRARPRPLWQPGPAALCPREGDGQADLREAMRLFPFCPTDRVKGWQEPGTGPKLEVHLL